jgi:hypothetical protein
MMTPSRSIKRRRRRNTKRKRRRGRSQESPGIRSQRTRIQSPPPVWIVNLSQERALTGCHQVLAPQTYLATILYLAPAVNQTNIAMTPDHHQIIPHIINNSLIIINTMVIKQTVLIITNLTKVTIREEDIRTVIAASLATMVVMVNEVMVAVMVKEGVVDMMVPTVIMMATEVMSQDQIIIVVVMAGKEVTDQGVEGDIVEMEEGETLKGEVMIDIKVEVGGDNEIMGMMIHGPETVTQGKMDTKVAEGVQKIQEMGMRMPVMMELLLGTPATCDLILPTQ